MTFFGLIGDLTPCKFTNKNELETDPPAIAVIVTIRPETSDTMVCGENPLVEAKKAFFGKKPFLGRVASQILPSSHL
jgi:hypothetical protein